ncbi:MAG TPA: hypothetical protein VD995_00670 [Azospirillum sp.]|nr:hypothetical protein [Azospirillum sp.]
MAHSVVRSFIAVALLFPAFCPPTAAQDAMDVQVVQAVAAIEAELAAFNQANRSTPEPQATTPAPRAARHVVYKARDLLGRVQMLRRLNGVEEQPIPNAPVKAMDSADAKDAVDKVASALRELRPAFGNPPIRPVSKAAGGTATDAYAGLLRAERALRTLDMPAIVPNEVYRVALQAVSDIDRIAASRGRAAVPPTPLPPGLTPRDAYDAAYQLVEEIKRLADEVPALAIPGGIVPPPRETGGISPETVVDLLTTIVADLSAVKVKAGVTQPTRRVPPQAGKTPSDTVAALRAARATISALREAGS